MLNDFHLYNSDNILSDKINWDNIKSWFQLRYNNASDIKAAYINGKHGIGKSRRIEVLAEEIGYEIELFSGNILNNETNIKEFLDEIVKSKSIFSILNINKKPKIYIVDETECCNIFKKIKQAMDYFCKLIHDDKYLQRDIVLFVGNLMIIKIPNELKSVCQVFNLEPPTTKELIDYLSSIFEKYKFKIAHSTISFIVDIIPKDISQVHYILADFFNYLKLKEKKYIKLDIIQEYFKNSLFKTATLYVYETTQDCLDYRSNISTKINNIVNQTNNFMLPLMINDSIRKHLYNIFKKRKLSTKDYIKTIYQIQDSFCIYDQFSTNSLNKSEISLHTNFSWYFFLSNISYYLKIFDIPRPCINTIQFTKAVNKKALRTVTIKKQTHYLYTMNIYNKYNLLQIIKYIGVNKTNCLHEYLNISDSYKRLLMCDKTNAKNN